MILREFDGDRLVQERAIALNKPVITFGRNKLCDYQLLPDSPQVSRVQAALQQQGDDWYLIDGKPEGLSSATGVWQNGKRIESPVKFLPDSRADIFQYGICRVELEFSTETEPQAHLNETYTGEGHLSEAMMALRRDLSHLSEQITQLSGAVAQTQARDSEQSSQLDRHDRLIRKVGLGMAVALLSLSTWNLSSGGKDAAEKAINIFLAIAGGTGSTYMLQKKSQPEEKGAG